MFKKAKQYNTIIYNTRIHLSATFYSKIFMLRCTRAKCHSLSVCLSTVGGLVWCVVGKRFSHSTKYL